MVGSVEIYGHMFLQVTGFIISQFKIRQYFMNYFIHKEILTI